MRSSCITEVDGDAIVMDPHTVVGADGLAKHLPTCARTRSADDRTEDPSPIEGWVEAAWWDGAKTPDKLVATWIVPPAPTGGSGELVYFFPSFTPADGERIVQPVMQYGVSPAGGGNYWAIASWYVTADTNQAKHSKLQRVHVGDTIVGTMTTSKCTAAGACTFAIVTQDKTTGVSTKLTVKETEPYTSAQAAVLEAYGVDTCSQLPPNNSLVFSNVQLTVAGAPVVKPWSAKSWDVSLGCGFAVSTAATNGVALDY